MKLVEKPVSADLNGLKDTKLGDRFLVTLIERNERNIPVTHLFTIKVVRTSGFGGAHDLAIVRSNSARYPAKEKWSIPLEAVLNDEQPPQVGEPDIYLKKFRLWMAVRSVLRERHGHSLDLELA